MARDIKSYDLALNNILHLKYAKQSISDLSYQQILGGKFLWHQKAIFEFTGEIARVRQTTTYLSI